MGGLSRREVAGRAGVDPGFVDRLVELAILPPEDDGRYGEGSVRRVRLIQMLERAGIALDGMAAGALPFELPGQAAARFDEIGPVELKGIAESVQLHVAGRSS